MHVRLLLLQLCSSSCVSVLARCVAYLERVRARVLTTMAVGVHVATLVALRQPVRGSPLDRRICGFESLVARAFWAVPKKKRVPTKPVLPDTNCHAFGGFIASFWGMPLLHLHCVVQIVGSSPVPSSNLVTVNEVNLAMT